METADLLNFATFVVGGAIMIALSPTHLPHSRSRWWRIARFVAFFSGSVLFFQSLYYVGRPGYLVLVRDIVGNVILAAALPMAIAWVVQRLTEKGVGPVARIVVATIILVISLPAIWITALFVHCTSGDCI